MDDDDQKNALPQSLPFVSYGPASRRRLTSIQSGRPPIDVPDPTSTTQRRSPRPVTETLQISDDRSPLSASPEQNVEPETAGEVEEISSEDASMVRLYKRIESMEERQKRMENILLELVGRAR